MKRTLAYHKATPTLVEYYSMINKIDQEKKEEEAKIQKMESQATEKLECVSSLEEQTTLTNENTSLTSSPTKKRGPQDSSKEDLGLKKSEQSKVIACSTVGCQRRGSDQCCNKACFFCCYEARNKPSGKCPFHLEKINKREAEDKLIDEALKPKISKPKKLPLFAEDKFTAVGQTVVVWCLGDFLGNKKWHEDVFNQEYREIRTNEMLKKRRRLNA